MLLCTERIKEGDSIGRILIVEFNKQESPAFDEVMEVLKRYPDFEYVQMNDDLILSVPGLEIYPSRRKIYRGRKVISLTTKEYDLFLLLVVNRRAGPHLWTNIPEGMGR